MWLPHGRRQCRHSNGDRQPICQTTVTVEEDNEYSFLAPNGDPWADTFMMAYGSASARISDSDRRVRGRQRRRDLDRRRLGLTDWPSLPTLAASRRQRRDVADESYDGLTDHPLTIVLPDGVLVEGRTSSP